ncbi:MAG: MBL fold metallo-hydrolase [Planctomycetota bacterium]|nr:MBL fold metallo-hydrolase [Planctomycetota bacterium]
MSGQNSSSPATIRPIQNLRITFWGVQGSCPIFPNPYGIQEYSRRLAVHTLAKAFDEMTQRAKGGLLRVEDLLGGPLSQQTIEVYQQKIGLPDLPFYGGETTCVEVETSEGNILIFDAGSGIRRCSLGVVEKWRAKQDRVLHLFGSHEHLDHRIGLTFSRFCYVSPRPFTVNVYGSYPFLHALDQHYGLFSRQTSDVTYVDDPVDYTQMSAVFRGFELHGQSDAESPNKRFWEVRELNEPITIGSTVVQPFEAYHAMTCCVGYRVEHNGKSFVFSTDHEFRRGNQTDPCQERSVVAEARLRKQCMDADLAYMDGQYYLEEYLGKKGIGSFPPVPRVDWGHGCMEDAIERTIQCRIKRTLVGHHDPEREWTHRLEQDRYLAKLCEGKAYQIELADSDRVIDL